MKDVGGEDNQIQKARGEDSMGLLALKRAIMLQFFVTWRFSLFSKSFP